MKDIIILGSTGSIGKQTLNVVRRYPERFNVIGLSCEKNIDLLEEQIREFHPKYAAVFDEKSGAELKKRIGNKGTDIIFGKDAPAYLAGVDEGELAVSAQVGISGLLPTVEAIKKGKSIALANKETLVTGGEYVMDLAREKGIYIYPVDSEHSAIWQALHFKKADGSVRKLILTASGGAFRDTPYEQLEYVTAKDALNHPTWNMGAKVTVDSATMMNKGLEVIEAMRLFDMPENRIDVVIHKESVIHSMVEYNDNSIIAEMSLPSMEIPIALALTYPERVESAVDPIDFAALSSLTFSAPDMRKFRCLALAREVARAGGLSGVVLNGANEVLVGFFLDGIIKYLDIPYYIERTLENFKWDGEVTPESILDTDKRVREYVKSVVSR